VFRIAEIKVEAPQSNLFPWFNYFLLHLKLIKFNASLGFFQSMWSAENKKQRTLYLKCKFVQI
ncbi:hypothetical protein JZU61_00750, partial [bacterium]|nr:hypothetical protein [bacterium]